MSIYTSDNSTRSNKITFIWVIVVLMITVSMAFADNTAQVNQKEDLKQAQNDLNFPVLKNWPAGNGEDAVWVESKQTMNSIGMDGLELDGPKYKMNFDASEPETKMIDPKRIYKNVAKIELFGWN